MLSLRIDTGPLTRTGSWWASLLGQSGHFGAILFISVAAGAAIACARRAAKPQGSAAQAVAILPPDRRVWATALGHFGALLVFALLSERVFRVTAGRAGAGVAWAAAWAVSGLATVVLWAVTAMPASAWARLARRWWPETLAAVAIGVSAWVAGRLTDGLWGWLCGPTFRFVRLLLGLTGLPCDYDPPTFLIGTPTFRVAVSEPCSGFQGIGMIWVFLAAYFWLFRRRLKFPHVLLLVPIGTALIWLANGARIALLVIFGTYVSPQIALGGFHSQVGWLMFIAVALGLMAVSQRVSLFSRQAAREGPAAATHNPTAAYLGPMVILLLAKMVTAAVSEGFDRFYVLSVLAAAAALWGWWGGKLRSLRIGQLWSAGGVGIGVAIFGIWLIMESVMPPGGPPSALAAGLAGMPAGWAAAWLIVRTIGSVTTVPLAEELAFRGYLMRRFVASDFEKVSYRTFTWFSFVASSVLFGALHGRWLAGTLAGMLLAWAAYRRGRLGDAVVAHALANALLAAYVLATGTWSLWG